MTCSACKGPFHPATGHAHTETMLICGVCATRFKNWVRDHTRRKWRGYRFYDYTETSREKPLTDDGKWAKKKG